MRLVQSAYGKHCTYKLRDTSCNDNKYLLNFQLYSVCERSDEIRRVWLNQGCTVAAATWHILYAPSLWIGW